MNGLAEPLQVERFRSQIAGRFGLHFDDSKLGWLCEVLNRRAGLSKRTCTQYLVMLDAPADREERGALLQELTVPETYFFRNIGQLDALREKVLPELARAKPPASCVRILSAGCASGEEPYSLAMALQDLRPLFPGGIAIHAVDICPALIEKARRGRYTSWSMRETPSGTRRHWFRPEGREWILSDAIRQSVSFDVCNLNDENASVWQAGPFDVIFCRNVLMYFSHTRASEAIGRLTRCLGVGGHMFLGHAETLRGLSNEYDLVHTHKAFYYRRRDCAARTGAPSIKSALAAQLAAVRTPPSAAPGALWFDAIQTSSDRIRHLSHRAQGAEDRRREMATPASSLADVLELFRQERYSDALRIFESLPQSAGGETRALLIHAILLAHDGQYARALDVCRQAIRADSMNAEAHYVQALCYENMGDTTGATERLQEAAYLDPKFAMPRLHLGLMARRTGDRTQARREFEQAIPLLEAETDERRLLFGGGYPLGAWLMLCRAELLVGPDAK